MDLVAGQLIGDFELLSPAGAGGFSVVWKARRSATGALVALKFPRVEALIDHLRREAGVSQRVSHPRLVPIIETHLDAEPPHLVMPWVEGTRLETPGNAPAPTAIVDALRVVRDLASVLATLHVAGIAHGDVKPGNVLVDAEGRCHLLDLGLAGAQVATRLERSLAQSLVSVDGRSIAGTLDFMAPELFDGVGPGVGSDVYSLGVLLHQALTGRPPAFGVAPSALNAYLPPGTEALLRRMLHHDPAQRAPSAGAVLDDLDDLITREKRCLRRKNGHERRRVFLSRMATVRRGLRALLVGSTLAFGLVVFVASANAASNAGHGTLGQLVADVATVLGILGGILCSTFLPLLLGMTTINAWIMGVPEKTYKNRAGHPIWSFMMQ